MLGFFEDAVEHVSDIDGDIHGKLARPPAQLEVAHWRREMSWLRRLQFEAVTGESLRAVGYPCQLRFCATVSGPLFEWVVDPLEMLWQRFRTRPSFDREVCR
jgi:hypothetical protein